MTDALVILAAGRGTRMRAAADVALDEAQARAADRGLKPLIPFGGHALIEYLLTSVADAGYTRVCIVVGPGEDPVRAHVAGLGMRRLRVTFAVQAEPRGSADALLAAESFANGASFAVVNADNDYPVAALRGLRDLSGPGLIGFTRAGLLEGGLAPDRIAGYALIETDRAGRLAGIVEKPTAAQIGDAGQAALVSMTCWHFGRAMFDACRAIGPSARGEYELPEAVLHELRRGERFAVIPMSAAVPDLSRREDIPRVAMQLQNRRIEL